MVFIVANIALKRLKIKHYFGQNGQKKSPFQDSFLSFIGEEFYQIPNVTGSDKFLIRGFSKSLLTPD